MCVCMCVYVSFFKAEIWILLVSRANKKQKWKENLYVIAITSTNFGASTNQISKFTECNCSQLIATVFPDKQLAS